MTRVGIIKARTIMLRGGRANYSNFSRVDKPGKTVMTKKSGGGTASDGGNTNDDTSSFWVPHPRTGIYFPLGHEWVMEDVPSSAASFGYSYWLRNVDGVEKPDPDQDSPT